MTHIFWQVSQQFAQVRRDPRLCLSWTLSVPTIRQEEEQLPTLHSDINQSPLSDPTAAFCCLVRHCCTHSGSAIHFFPLELVLLSFSGCKSCKNKSFKNDLILINIKYLDGENIVKISFTLCWQRFCSKFKIQISTRLLAGSETGSLVKLQAVLYLTPNGAKTDLNHYFHTGADSCKLNLIHLDSLFYL